MSEKNLAVIIVSRDLRGLLHSSLRQLRSALRNIPSAGAHEIVVVDNASQPPYLHHEFVDDTEESASFRIIRFDTHCGFGEANNIAVAKTAAPWICFLNNDVFLHPRALQIMVTELLERRAEIAGTRMVFPDGSIQHCGVVFGAGEVGPHHIHRRVISDEISRANKYFQSVTGACLMLSRELFSKLGGFSEVYGFGLEDIDLCLRARQLGSRILCCNEVDSLHFESMTPGRVELDVPARKHFMRIWKGKYTVDG